MMKQEIKFISYDGKYPNLCSGKLTLEIDGETVTFGHDRCDYYSFWRSGGSCHFTDFDYTNNIINEGEWELDEAELPEKYKNIGEELIKVFNDNVIHGCCGGCL